MVSSNLCVLFLIVPFVVLVSGEHVISNETLTDAETAERYHNYSTIAPEVSVNVSLLFDDTLPTKASRGDSDVTMEINATQEGKEASHNLPHSSSSYMIIQINETLLLNGTLEANMTREDDESFQDQEKTHSHWHCNSNALEYYINACAEVFQNQMFAIAKERWCDWEEVINPYNALSVCVEYVAGELRCYYPNQQTQAFFLDTHEDYFRSCTEEEEEDAPHGLVVALTLLPVSLIPVLVSVVVWKNKDRD
ncbi:hypothetical protein ACEWY4_025994 [Coilia grayii]|uniref:Receptor activity-modifying protein 1 n=1 Tax=Coilia grayii TaxID=363190 RepID=A0ABD1IUJ3_9TELE